MFTRMPVGRRLAALAAIVIALTGCLDGPFAHTNPHDAEAPITLTIVGGADTLRAVGDQALYQLVTAPVTNGYTPAWTTTTGLITSLGFGRYQVAALPVVATTVEIKATLGGKSATRNIVILPAP